LSIHKSVVTFGNVENKCFPEAYEESKGDRKGQKGRSTDGQGVSSDAILTIEKTGREGKRKTKSGVEVTQRTSPRATFARREITF